MKKKNFLDAVDVPVPCDKSWDEMIGDDVSRFCKHCEKDIYNISAMTRREAKKLLFQSKEKVCIRMERESDGRIKTLKKQLHQITRQMPLVAGVLTATLILSGVTKAQETKVEAGKITITQTAGKNSKPRVSGTITDANGAVIPNVKVILLNTKDNLVRTTVSDKDGIYEFKDVIPSIYTIETKDGAGFKDFTYLNLNVEPNKNINLTITLYPKENAEVVGLITTNSEIKTETPPIDNKITPRQIQDLPLLPNPERFVLGLFPGVKEEKSKKNINTSQISFTIFDTRGEVIPNAEVKLTNTKTQQIFVVKTNEKGVAYFSRLPRGLYEIKASAQGFHNGVMSLLVAEKVEPNIKMTLEVGSVTGIFVFNEYKIPIFNSIIQEDVDIIKKYVAAKKNVNIRDKFSSNKTMLHAAAQSGNIEIIKLLVNAGANINAKDKFGRTPLLLINDEDEEETIKILKLFIAKGADVNVRDKDYYNRTLLMEVCKDNNFEMAKILLEAGANPNLKDEDGETALQKTKSEEIKKLLKKYGAK